MGIRVIPSMALTVLMGALHFGAPIPIADGVALGDYLGRMLCACSPAGLRRKPTVADLRSPDLLSHRRVSEARGRRANDER